MTEEAKAMSYAFGQTVTFNGRSGVVIDSQVFQFPHKREPVTVLTLDMDPTPSEYGKTVLVTADSPLLRKKEGLE